MAAVKAELCGRFFVVVFHRVPEVVVRLFDVNRLDRLHAQSEIVDVFGQLLAVDQHDRRRSVQSLHVVDRPAGKIGGRDENPFVGLRDGECADEFLHLVALYRIIQPVAFGLDVDPAETQDILIMPSMPPSFDARVTCPEPFTSPPYPIA